MPRHRMKPLRLRERSKWTATPSWLFIPGWRENEQRPLWASAQDGQQLRHSPRHRSGNNSVHDASSSCRNSYPSIVGRVYDICQSVPHLKFRGKGKGASLNCTRQSRNVVFRQAFVRGRGPPRENGERRLRRAAFAGAGEPGDLPVAAGAGDRAAADPR